MDIVTSDLIELKLSLSQTPVNGIDREILNQISLTSLKTKLPEDIATKLSEICVEAVLCIDRRDQDEPLDLHMVEILTMKHKLVSETRLVRGMVLDHGSRHPDMPAKLENCNYLKSFNC